MDNITRELVLISEWLNTKETSQRIKEAGIAVTMAVTREAEFTKIGVEGRTTICYVGDFAGMTVTINSMIDNVFKNLNARQKLILKSAILACLNNNTKDLDEDDDE